MVRKALCDLEIPSKALIPLLRVINLMKTEWLVTDVTPVGSPARAELDILEVILDIFWPFVSDVTAVVSPARAERGIFGMVLDVF